MKYRGILLFGEPGAGKGIRARIRAKFSAPYRTSCIAVVDILRHAVKK